MTTCPDTSVLGQLCTLMTTQGSKGRLCSAPDGESQANRQESLAPGGPWIQRLVGASRGQPLFPRLPPSSVRSCLNLALKEDLQVGEALQACMAMGAW